MRKLLDKLWLMLRWYPKPLNIRIKVRPSRQLRLEEWQASEFLVSEGKRLLSDTAFQVALDVLRNESPVNYGLPDLGVQPTDRIAHQSKTEGYHLALNNIEALATFKVAQRHVEATFEPPEVEAPTGAM